MKAYNLYCYGIDANGDTCFEFHCGSFFTKEDAEKAKKEIMTEVEQSDVGHKMEDVEFSVTPISGLYNDSVVDIVRLINKHL